MASTAPPKQRIQGPSRLRAPHAWLGTSQPLQEDIAIQVGSFASKCKEPLHRLEVPSLSLWGGIFTAPSSSSPAAGSCAAGLKPCTIIDTWAKWVQKCSQRQAATSIFTATRHRIRARCQIAEKKSTFFRLGSECRARVAAAPSLPPQALSFPHHVAAGCALTKTVLRKKWMRFFIYISILCKNTV